MLRGDCIVAGATRAKGRVEYRIADGPGGLRTAGVRQATGEGEGQQTQAQKAGIAQSPVN